MLTKRVAVDLPKVLKRNIGIVAPVLQKASDPIQKLFIDKLREYKSKSDSGSLPDPPPELKREREAEMERLAKQYGGSNRATMSDFPKFQFKDPVVEVGPIKN